jgi:hypothetical protein
MFFGVKPCVLGVTQFMIDRIVKKQSDTKIPDERRLKQKKENNFLTSIRSDDLSRHSV